MKAYRIYLVAADGRLQLGEAFQAANDAEAASLAAVLAPRGRAAELWASGRLIGRLSKDGKFQAAP